MPGIAFVAGGGLLLISIMLIMSIRDKHKRKKREAEEKAQFERQRNELLQQIAGRPLLIVAGVPREIYFSENGLPIDNNDKTYGSFTVYHSYSGKCYHEKQGCSSAYTAIHIISAKERKLSPCAKCCKRQHDIPGWYNEYMTLVKKCKKYDIPLDNAIGDSSQ